MGRIEKKSSREELLKIITESSFAMYDLILFLDTHPFDAEALSLYKEYKKINKMAVEEYTETFGPLSSYDVKTDNKWTWIESPWPWERSCE